MGPFLSLEMPPAAALARLEQTIESLEAETSSSVQLALLHFRAAQVYLAQGDDPEGRRALEHLWSAWRLRPEDPDVRLVLARCLSEQNKVADLTELYRRSAERIGDTQEQIGLLFRAAELHQQAGEIEEALAVLRSIADRSGHSLVADWVRTIRSMFHSPLLRGEGHLSQRSEALSLLLLALKGDERFSCALELAALREAAGDEQGAEAAYRTALAEHPADRRVLMRVVRRLEQRGEFVEITRLFSSAAQASALPAERARLLRRLAGLFEDHLSDVDRAIQLWWHAWEEKETGEEAGHLKRLYSARREWGHCQRVLERQVQRATGTESKVAAYRELAVFQRETMRDELGAAQSYGYLLQLAPDDEAALAARVEIFERRGLEEETRSALRRHARHSGKTAQRDRLLRRIARMEMRRADRFALLGVLEELDPSDSENRVLLREFHAGIDVHRDRELFVKTGILLLKMGWRSGQEIGTSVEEALEFARRCAELGEVGQAADSYLQVLELVPDHADARSRLTELGAPRAGSEQSAEDMALRAEQLAKENPRRAVRLLLRAAQVARQEADGAERPLALTPQFASVDPAARGSLVPGGVAPPRSTESTTSSARLAPNETSSADRDQLRRTVGLVRRAFALCPEDARPELELLEEALRSVGAHAELANLLRRRAEKEKDLAERKFILGALARLYREQLLDPKLAVAVLEDLFALDRDDALVAEEIRDIHLKLEDHGALARFLEERLATASGPRRVELLQELGRLYAGVLKDEVSALNRYGELLALLPNHGEALAFCRAHDEALGNFREVAVLLCRAAEYTADPVEQAATHREIARIAEQRLHDLDFAVVHWQRVVALSPGDGEARGELRRVLTQAGRFREVEAVLLSEASRSFGVEEKIPLYLELAQIAGERLSDDQRAIFYLRLAQQLAPTNREVLSQLEPVYERLGLWRELVSTLRRHAEVEPEPDDQARLLHRAARLLFVCLKRDEEALALCRRVREMRPGDRVTVTLMGEILVRRGLWKEKATLLREQIGVEADPTERSRLHLELGHLLLERMNDQKAALVQFEHAMETDGAASETLPLLRQVYESQGRLEHLAEFMERRAMDEKVSPRERAAAFCELGRIWETHQGDADAAQQAYERATGVYPDYLPAVAGLRDLAMRRGQWREAVAFGRKQVALSGEPAERSRILLELAQVLEERLSRPSAAATALEEALADDPSNRRAAERLALFHYHGADWERAKELLEKVVEGDPEPEGLHEHHYRLGFAEEQLGHEEEAFAQYVKSFGRQPLYLPTLERLVEICYLRRQWDNTLRIAGAIVSTYDSEKTPEELADLYLRIGLCELHLAQREVALVRLRDLVLQRGEAPSTPPEAWLDVADCWAATPLDRQLLPHVPHEVLGRVEKAMERALDLAPDHPGPPQVLAATAFALGEWDRVLHFIERAAASPKVERDLRVGLLLCAGDVLLHRLQAHDRAREYCRRALVIWPDSAAARKRMAAMDETPSEGLLPTIPLPQIDAPAVASPAPPPPFRATANQPPPLPPRSPAGTAPRPAPRSKPRKPDEEQ